jgi:hypothetical protein
MGYAFGKPKLPFTTMTVMVTPNRGHVHFDLDLREADGAAVVVEVAEDVKIIVNGKNEAKPKVIGAWEWAIL